MIKFFKYAITIVLISTTFYLPADLVNKTGHSVALIIKKTDQPDSVIFFKELPDKDTINIKYALPKNIKSDDYINLEIIQIETPKLRISGKIAGQKTTLQNLFKHRKTDINEEVSGKKDKRLVLQHVDRKQKSEDSANIVRGNTKHNLLVNFSRVLSQDKKQSLYTRLLTNTKGAAYITKPGSLSTKVLEIWTAPRSFSAQVLANKLYDNTIITKSADTLGLAK